MPRRLSNESRRVYSSELRATLPDQKAPRPVMESDSDEICPNDEPTRKVARQTSSLLGTRLQTADTHSQYVLTIFSVVLPTEPMIARSNFVVRPDALRELAAELSSSRDGGGGCIILEQAEEIAKSAARSLARCQLVRLLMNGAATAGR